MTESTGTLQDLAQAARKARTWREEAEKQLQDAKDTEAMVLQEIEKRMEADDVKTVTFPNVGKFTRIISAYPRATKGVDPELVINWFKAEGVEIAPPKIDNKRLREAFEERQENDKPLPPEELVQVYREQSVRFTPER